MAEVEDPLVTVASDVCVALAGMEQPPAVVVSDVVFLAS